MTFDPVQRLQAILDVNIWPHSQWDTKLLHIKPVNHSKFLGSFKLPAPAFGRALEARKDLRALKQLRRGWPAPGPGTDCFFCARKTAAARSWSQPDPVSPQIDADREVDGVSPCSK